MKKAELLQKLDFTTSKLIGFDDLEIRLNRVVTKKGVKNVLIVGDDGIGKTALAKSLSKNFNDDYLVLNKEVLLDTIYTYHPEKLEVEKIKQIFQNLKNKFVLIDDIETLFSDEKIFQNRFLNIFKILLQNNFVSIIATTDPASYKLYFEKNSILNKEFEIIKMFEPNDRISELIVESHIPLFEKKYEVEIDKSLAKKLVILTNRYINLHKQPHKSLNILDEVCNYTRLKESKLVKSEDVKFIISERTGIPIAEVNLSDKKKLQNLEKLLFTQVKGQLHALNRIARVIRRSKAGIQDPKRPLGSFLFLGPSGVGKTHLAKTLAKHIYNSEKSLIRIDMSEFNESHNVQRLIGAPPGYVGYEEGGQLTNPVWEKPYSLILLDEIEKAHPRVFDIFLQMIDEGRLTDGQGKTVNFNNTIIIATSNIGIDFIIENYEQNPEYVLSEAFIKNEMMPLLLQYFRPEFINRFDDLVVFKPLNIEDLIAVAKLSVKEINERLKEKEISIDVSNQTLEKLATASLNPKFGARPLKRLIRENIEDYLANEIIFGRIERGTHLSW